MKYIDLGLKSGTLWANANEDGYYTFNEAVAKYGDRLPTKEQFEELKDNCQWEWTGRRYKVTGPNGKSIVLPVVDYRYYYGGVDYVGSYGCYWSSTPDGLDYAWNLSFGSSIVYMDRDDRLFSGTVRLIKRK